MSAKKGSTPNINVGIAHSGLIIRKQIKNEIGNVPRGAKYLNIVGMYDLKIIASSFGMSDMLISLIIFPRLNNNIIIVAISIGNNCIV